MVRVLEIILFLKIFMFCYCYGESTVPVLLWNEKLNPENFPRVSALHQLNYETFQAKYFNRMKPQNVLLFIQDALSVEDLSSHAQEMSHIAKIMGGDHSLYLPSVYEPAQLPHTLASHGFNVITLGPGEATSGINLREGKNLIVVKLPSTTTNPSRRNALQKADEVIASVLSKIGKMAEFTVMFTGKKSSMDMDENVDHVRVARSLQQKIGSEVYAPPTNFYTTDCILLFLRSPITLVKGTASVELKDTDVYNSDCQAGKQQLSLSYVNVELGDTTYSKIVVLISFKDKGSYWTLDGGKISTIKDKGVPTDREMNSTAEMDWVPKRMSFACALEVTLQDLESGFKIILSSFQVQAFGPKKAEKFGTSWDCVGFFTVSIWSGLLASILATIILAWGLYMLADVRTMDRFDDPKGKSIMIPNSAE